MTKPDPESMTGLELLRHGSDDDRPSLRRLIGMRFDELEFGRVVMSMEAGTEMANPLGTMHGGITAALL
ncbi:MAG: thioesterase, partial [Actinobacteria bacterium]|nr:thioesterase [Actinomycetota bacterium]